MEAKQQQSTTHMEPAVTEGTNCLHDDTTTASATTTTTDVAEHDAAEMLNSNKLNEFLDMVCELRQRLDERTNECGLLKNNEDSKKAHDEVTKSKKLEEDYVKLMSNYLNLEERFEQHRQNLYNNYLAKTNAINNYECIMSREVIKHELEECKAELHQRTADLCLVSAKLRNLEEDNNTKENHITELRKSLGDAKVVHKYEITVLEEYIQCLKNTITSYEKTLATYLDADRHETPSHPRGLSNIGQDDSMTSMATPDRTVDGEEEEVTTTTTATTTTSSTNAVAQDSNNTDHENNVGDMRNCSNEQ